ncbi:MAG: metal ABC transporter permease, partial [Candidatus Dadabacteria bacterium]|nr:metal ABC transporter permease [Candidatus Dadabacteria bacterium]
MAVLDIALISIVYIFYKQLLATTFDEEFAKLRGIYTEYFYILLLSMVAITVVLLIQIVGLILVLALLVLPAASASQFVHSIKKMIYIAIILCLFSTTMGIVVSYQPD